MFPVYFELQSHQFTTERAKVAFIISLLTGRALQWAEALWSSQSPRINSLEDFVEHFREVFSQPTTEVSVHDELFQLRQADSSIHEYTLRFRTLTAGIAWNEVALLSTYRRGLNPALRQQMSIYDDSVGFESFLQKAAHVSPIWIPYPLSIPERTAMEEYIKEALNQEVIRPSTSPAASSFFFVAKKDGGLRPCIDYRVLNDQTVKFAYPLPLVPAALEELRGSCFFRKLDLRSAYNLIRIRRGDEWKTATGHYEYRVMPYGLSNSPSVFQNLMHDIFRDMINRFVLIYIDDILIYSPTIEEHRRHVTQVLQRLHQHYLYLKTEKCEFHKSTIHFLGYIVTPARVCKWTRGRWRR